MNSFQRDIEIAVEYLREIGIDEIYLFGSQARGDMRDDSDIDIAVRGIPAQEFFFVLGELLTRLDHSIDLVDLDLQKYLGERLEMSGELMRLA